METLQIHVFQVKNVVHNKIELFLADCFPDYGRIEFSVDGCAQSCFSGIIHKYKKKFNTSIGLRENSKQILCQTCLEAVIPEAAALLESQEVCQCSGISLDSEAPGLPLSVRNPRYIDVEAVEVICRRELGRTHLQSHQVEVRTEVEGQTRCKLDVAAQAECLSEIVLIYDLSVSELV